MYAPGIILAGKYRIETVLGEGGMGMVVAATHIGLGTPVALKFLHPHLVGHQGLIERFMREARASAQLRSEHVCRVSDVGQFEDGTAYIVMELLHGTDLARMLKARGTLPPLQAVDYMLQACLGIAEAHAMRIVHRDLKPANLFVTQRPDGTPLVKVLDFGIAKAPQEGNFSLTQTANVMGSPGYMSPEQLRSSKEADARSDIWSLGVTLYELLAGRPPWHADSITELTLRIAMDPLPALSSRVPPELAAALVKTMEKDPNARYQNVASFASALAPFGSVNATEVAAGVARVLRGSNPIIVGSNLADAGAPTIATPTTLGASSGAVTHAPRARSWKLPAILAAAIAVGGIVGLVAATAPNGDGVRVGNPPQPQTTPSPPLTGDGVKPVNPPARPERPNELTTFTPSPPPPTPEAVGSGSAAPAKKPTKKPTHRQDTKTDINDSRI